MILTSRYATPPRSPSSSLRPAATDTVAQETPLLAPETYYDGVKDLKDREAYYAGVAVNYAGLSKLVTDTHTTPLSYGPKHNLYTWVDMRPSLRVRSIYSDKPVQAGDPLKGRHDPDAPKLAALLAAAPSNAMELAVKIALSDCRNFYNCEHAVPKVWSGNNGIAEGDLHHLFVAERTVNEGRGSKKLTESHPQSGKGELARATLYYLLRYPGFIGDHPDEYNAKDVGVLLQWHKENPVTLHELHRNQAIAGLQGNRNPLIDHPEWADRIDFTQGLAR